MPYSHQVRKRHCKSGTKSNAIFTLPAHGSTSSVGRKSNAIFALPGHGSTSSVGRKSNVIFALPGHGSTSSVGRKSNVIFALPGHGSTSSVGSFKNPFVASSETHDMDLHAKSATSSKESEVAQRKIDDSGRKQENHTSLALNKEESTEIGIPEAHHHVPVFSKDLEQIKLLHLNSGYGRKGACSTGWEEKIRLHPCVLVVIDEAPKQKELKCNQGGISKREHRLVRLADIHKVKIVRMVTGSPNQEDIDRSGDPEDHLKLFQSAAKTEGWAMPTWCHMFNSTLTGNARVWFDKLPKESIDSYEDLRTAFRENYLQQTKHIKDPVEIHHIKQRDGESTEDFMERYKAENDKPKAPKKGEVAGKDKPLAILMIQPWERVAKPRITQSFSPETAISFPPLGKEDGTEGPMIIEAEMGGHFVHRVYVDGGASSEVLYEHCFVKLRKEIRDQMVPATTHLIGFSGETIWPLGQIALLVKIGDEVHSTSAWMNFMVIRSPSQHNAIIGRPGIRKIRAVPSTAHGMLKFPVKGGTVTLQSSKVIPMECAMISGPSIQSPVANQIPKEKINIAIHPEYPEQTVAIGSTLTEKGRKELCSVLKQNLDIFAWKPADMTGVPRNIAEHRLNIREGYTHQQKKIDRHGKEIKVIPEESVEKYWDAGIMKEVHYHSWLSNPVMVKKHDGTWRMCVDFKDLNNACPKDCYPLPEIDWKVESLYGYPFKC
ncbi:reverse transcriptase domain-containing protein [Tanacetum coccineum]